MIVSAMKLEGMSEQEAQQTISLFDASGLIEPSRKDLSPEQENYAHPASPTKDLLKAVKTLKLTILIGVSTIKGAFTQKIIQTMLAGCVVNLWRAKELLSYTAAAWESSWSWYWSW